MYELFIAFHIFKGAVNYVMDYLMCITGESMSLIEVLPTVRHHYSNCLLPSFIDGEQSYNAVG